MIGCQGDGRSYKDRMEDDYFGSGFDEDLIYDNARTLEMR